MKVDKSWIKLMEKRMKVDKNLLKKGWNGMKMDIKGWMLIKNGWHGWKGMKVYENGGEENIR